MFCFLLILHPSQVGHMLLGIQSGDTIFGVTCYYGFSSLSMDLSVIMLNFLRCQVRQSMQGGQAVNTNWVDVLAVAGLVTDR